MTVHPDSLAEKCHTECIKPGQLDAPHTFSGVDGSVSPQSGYESYSNQSCHGYLTIVPQPVMLLQCPDPQAQPAGFILTPMALGTVNAVDPYGAMSWGSPCWFPPENSDDYYDYSAENGRRRPRRARKATKKDSENLTPPDSCLLPYSVPKDSGDPAQIDLETLSSDTTDMINSLGDSRCLIDHTALSGRVVAQLEQGDSSTTTAILAWVIPNALELALSVGGCRVIQTLLSTVGGDAWAKLVEKFRGHSLKFVDSPHGNHVLQKCIEVMPPTAVRFISEDLMHWPGGWLALAKHRFGCRVVERLLEHCPEEMTGSLLQSVTRDACALCRHPYGNYVVQHVLEYGSAAQKSAVVSALCNGDIVALAQHRVASNVIERALAQCGPDGQRAIASAVLAVPPALLAMGCSRYGSFTVKRLLEVLAGPLREQAVYQLSAGTEQLRASKHGKSLVERLAAAPARNAP